MMLPVLLFICLFDHSSSVEIDNGLVGHPEVDCGDTAVTLTFQSEKPFSGRVYVKGLADRPQCASDFTRNNVTSSSRFSIQIGQGDCSMKRRRVFGAEEPFEGLVMSIVVVVSFHGTFVTKADRAFRCMCFFRNIKRVTNELDMSMIGTTDLLDTAQMPMCFYEIRKGSPDGLMIRYAKLGDKLYHVWRCEDPSRGFLVHSCWVNDGRGQRYDLIDIDGCAIDSVIQQDITYTPDLQVAYVETHGYKFSDTPTLDFQCVVELCQKEMGDCNGLTPPDCSRRAGVNPPGRPGGQNGPAQVQFTSTVRPAVFPNGPGPNVVYPAGSLPPPGNYQNNPSPRQFGPFNFNAKDNPIPNFYENDGPIPNLNVNDNPILNLNVNDGPILNFNPNDSPIPNFNPNDRPIPNFNPKNDLIPSTTIPKTRRSKREALSRRTAESAMDLFTTVRVIDTLDDEFSTVTEGMSDDLIEELNDDFCPTLSKQVESRRSDAVCLSTPIVSAILAAFGCVCIAAIARWFARLCREKRRI